MATYVNDLRLKEIATGDESGTWGTSTNTNLELIANAMGLGAETIPNASTHTITMADGTADEFRSTFLRLTGGGTACTVTLAPNTLSHTWIMRNETAAALTLTQGSGANVTIAAGQTKIVATDGAGSGAIVYEMDDLELAGNLAVTGSVTATGDVGIGGAPLADNQLLLTDAGTYSQFHMQNSTSGSGASDGFRILMDGVNTTITNHETGYMAFETQNTERMRIDSSGSVGIGTSPEAGYRMDILGASGYDDIMRITGLGTNIGPRINLTPTGTGVSRINGTANGLQLQTSGTPALTIDSDGSISIPNQNAINELTFTGTEFTNVISEATSGFELGTSGSGYLRFLTSNAERMRIDSGGNTGIGTSVMGARLNVETAASAGISYPLDIRNPQNAAGTGAGAMLRIHSTSDANRGVGIASYSTTNYATDNSMLFYTSSSSTLTERMRIDSNGNVQIGTGTPAYLVGTSDIAQLSVNRVGTSGVITNASRSAAFINLSGTDGGSTIEFATASANNTTPTERMRIDSSGALVLNNSGGDAQMYFGGVSGTNRMYLARSGGDTLLWNVSNGLMRFGTNNTERMRINNGGYIKMSPTGTYVSVTGSYHEMQQNNAGIANYIYNASTNGDALLLNTNNENATNYFLRGFSDSAARDNIYIYSNGNIVNRNNSYGTFSDQKLKQDIEDASSQWEDVRAIKFRKYRWKQDVAADADAPYQLGVIAQELESAGMNGLVEETADKEFYQETVTDDDGNDVLDEDGNAVTEQKERLTGETTKSVKISILYAKGMIALQEAMTRIETLEAKVQELENN